MVVVAWQAVLDGKENNSVVDGWLSTWAQFSRRLCVSWGGMSIFNLFVNLLYFQLSIFRRSRTIHRSSVQRILRTNLHALTLIPCMSDIVYCTYW